MEILGRDGKSPHKGGDSINSYEVRVIEDKIYDDEKVLDMHQKQNF
jgi:hypothetical protein